MTVWWLPSMALDAGHRGLYVLLSRASRRTRATGAPDGDGDGGLGDAAGGNGEGGGERGEGGGGGCGCCGGEPVGGGETLVPCRPVRAAVEVVKPRRSVP